MGENVDEENGRSDQPGISIPGRMDRNHPPLQAHVFRDSVSVRRHSVWAFLTQWKGSVTEQIWPKVLAYALYNAVVVVLFKMGCADVHDADNCTLHAYKLHIEDMLGLWMAFTAYLFTSFVNAGLNRFDSNLGSVRSMQGRINEMSLLLHTYANKNDGEGENKPLSEAMRLLTALTYCVYSAPELGGCQAEYFYTHATSHLSKDQSDNLSKINPSDRTFTIMMWLSRTVLENTESSSSRNNINPAFSNPHASFSTAVVNCMERFRGQYGTLTDTLEDPIVPFPFANLTIANIYLIFVVLPFSIVHKLGYALIPAGAIYYWFLEGMITFVFFVDQPFYDKIASKRKKELHPLIDAHSVTDGTVQSLPRRFPAALAHEPKYHVE